MFVDWNDGPVPESKQCEPTLVLLPRTGTCGTRYGVSIAIVVCCVASQSVERTKKKVICEWNDHLMDQIIKCLCDC